MLKKNNRITHSRDFLKIFKTIKPVHTAHLAMRVAKRNQRTEEQKNKRTDSLALPQNDAIAKKLQSTSYKLPSRFGFVVSNKIDKRSSRRNGLKRRIRAVFERKLPEIRDGYDVVIQVKKSFDYPYNFTEIEAEVNEALPKMGILK